MGGRAKIWSLLMSCTRIISVGIFSYHVNARRRRGPERKPGASLHPIHANALRLYVAHECARACPPGTVRASPTRSLLGGVHCSRSTPPKECGLFWVVAIARGPARTKNVLGVSSCVLFNAPDGGSGSGGGGSAVVGGGGGGRGAGGLPSCGGGGISGGGGGGGGGSGGGGGGKRGGCGGSGGGGGGGGGGRDGPLAGRSGRRVSGSGSGSGVGARPSLSFRKRPPRPGQLTLLLRHRLNGSFGTRFRAVSGSLGGFRPFLRPDIIHVVWSLLTCLRNTLWSFTPNDVDDTGPYRA